MINKLLKHIYINILLLLLLAYSYNDLTASAQAGFAEANRGIVYVCLLAIIAWVGLYVLWNSRTYKVKTPLLGLLVTLASWVLLVNLVTNADPWIMGIHTALNLWWILTYLFFATYPNKNQGANNSILVLIIVMFLFYIWGNLLLRANITATKNIDFAISGFIYQLVMMLPFLMLIKKKTFRVILFVILLFMVVTSFKRGAIIATFAMGLIYIYTDAVVNKKSFKFFGQLFLMLIICSIFITVIDSQSGGFISKRFSAESMADGSGRSDMWRYMFSQLSKRDFINLFFGGGSGSTIKLLGTGAHNEWLELLYSFGLVGIGLYAILYLKIYLKYRHLKQINSIYAPHYGMIFMYLLCVSMYSGMYFQHSTFYIMAFLGFGEYLTNKSVTIDLYE